MMVTVARPQNARIIRDGKPIPLELAYAGVEDDIHVWRTITPLQRGDSVHIDCLPARASIQFGGSDG
ncbi:hypothetical protein [Antrihabitans spumae]|uniref:Uncharacterized protein n=1 Tax=Antrihabitans spumae TaxID=3373370 RepID=A0ABW7KA55_9NOCA